MTTIRPISQEDHEWAHRLLTEAWGSTQVVSRGVLHHVMELPGFVAEHEGNRVGLLTYHINGLACELVTINSLVRGLGVATSLIETLKSTAREAGCQRVWLVTTNDNMHALRFYQKRGFQLIAFHRDAVTDSRKLKPQIPARGLDDIPIEHELELELRLL
ncbi:MAG: GNAT family N-acetyltransferase [Chloroflexi bacterium]|nr:GNAT family N-acetyltransferase [Chloroflexota bacterium]